MSYRFADSLRAGSGQNQLRPDPARKQSANLYDTYQCCVYSEQLLDVGLRNFPKYLEFYFKNKFQKLVNLVGFIIRVDLQVLIIIRAVKLLHSDARLTQINNIKLYFNLRQ